MKLLFLLLGLSISFSLTAQKEIALEPFHTIVSGPHIQLNLTSGLTEKIVLESSDISLDEVVCKVKGKKLHIYLKHARSIEKQERFREPNKRWSRGVYADVSVTANITFRMLKKLVTKGEEDIRVQSSLDGPSLKYKSFGDQDVTLSSVKTEKFRAKLYGSTQLKITSGYADLQRYKLYGEHNIDTKSVKSKKVRTSNFGEVDLDVNSEVVHLTSFGVADITNKSRAKLLKGIVIGETRFRTSM